MDRPFTFITLSTICGIILSYNFVIPSKVVILLMFIAFLVFLFMIIKDKPNHILILFLFLLLGILISNINKESKLETYLDQRSNFIGVVDENIKLDEDYSKYAVIIKEVDKKEVDEKIILSIYGETRLNLGDIVSINGELKTPARNSNPKMYNYRLNLLSDKIYTSMAIEDYSIQTIGLDEKFAYSIKDKFTKEVSNLFQSYLKKENAQLITSIILGKSSYLDEDDLVKYRDLGLAHILAVSGLHIGIITSFIIYTFSRIGINRRLNVILSLAIIWLYIYIIGFPASAVRAGLMFSLLFLSQLVHEPYDSINTIMLSILISLIINPFWLFNLGFQLSYLATISILIFAPKIMRLFYPFKSSIIVTIASILGVNIGLLPLQAYYFNVIPILGLISNIITVPLLSIALIMGIIMIILNHSFVFLNIFLGYLLNLILSFQYWIVDTLYKIPINTISIYSPGIMDIFFFYLIIALIFNYIRISEYKPFIIKKLILYYLIGMVFISTLNLVLDDSIEIEFIDVGQGDSILIKTQESTYLMDTGGSLFASFDIGKNITMPYLLKQGINKLDGVIISHFDEDHSQGLEALMNKIEIDAIYASYSPSIEMENKINSHKIPLIYINNSHSLILDRNTSIKVIWPKYKTSLNSFSSNNKSLVTVLTYKDFDVLFTGDIEGEVEQLIIEDLPEHIEILKVPHHGSKTSSTSEFVDRINPEYSIISVGKNNFYGHPNKDVVERLQISQSIIYRTDVMGRIKITLDDSISISPFLKSAEEVDFTAYFLDNIIFILFYLIYYLISYILIKIYLLGRSAVSNEFC